jgi:hypothetical protein
LTIVSDTMTDGKNQPPGHPAPRRTVAPPLRATPAAPLRQENPATKTNWRRKFFWI